MLHNVLSGCKSLKKRSTGMAYQRACQKFLKIGQFEPGLAAEKDYENH